MEWFLEQCVEKCKDIAGKSVVFKHVTCSYTKSSRRYETTSCQGTMCQRERNDMSLVLVFLPGLTEYCSCHEKWHLNGAKCCTCHERCHWNFTKCCACHVKWHLNFNQCCACHVKWHLYLMSLRFSSLLFATLHNSNLISSESLLKRIYNLFRISSQTNL